MLRKHSLYPFLLAAWPPLALGSQNTSQLGGLPALLPPLLAGLATAFLGWAIGVMAGAGPAARAAIAALVAAWFWSYRWQVHLIQASPVVHALGLGQHGGMISAVALGLVAYLLKRRVPVQAPGITGFLNLGALILVGTAGLSLGRALWTDSRVADPPARPVTAQARAAGQPDVYILILDSYTGRASLASHHGYDNEPFLHELRAEGFLVPEGTRANYTQTFLALGAMLNWDYVERVAAGRGISLQHESDLYPAVIDNATYRHFVGLGYRFTFYRSGTPYLSGHPWADEQRPRRARNLGSFRAYWPRMTPIPEFRTTLCRVVQCPARVYQPWIPESAQDIDSKFEALAAGPSGPGPHLVVAHLMVPHEPFIYHRDCTHRRPAYWPDMDRLADTTAVVAAYLEQLQCVNMKVLRVVRSLRQRPGPAPIIILQSDHGQAFTKQQVPEYANTPLASIDERLDIFAAYLAPDSLLSRLYDGITPVNAFRLLLGDSAGQPLAPLPDRSFWSSRARPFDFSEVPPPVGAGEPR